MSMYKIKSFVKECLIMKCLFIYNPESGKGKIKKKEDYIVGRLKEKYDGVSVERTTRSGHAREIALRNIGAFDTYVVAGGDGTLNEVVSAIAEKDNAPNVGYIPTGTVNDVAHSLGISKNVKKALDTILYGKEFCHDVFKCNDRYGLYVLAIGTIAESSYATKQKSKKAFGKIAYFFHGAGKIFNCRSFPVKMEFDGGVIEQNAALLLAMNSKHVAGFTVNKTAELSDGLVDVVIIENTKKRNRVTFASLLKIARLFIFKMERGKKIKGLTYLKLDKFKLSTSDATSINLDGEFGFNGSFDFKVIKSGIRILI